MIPGMALTVARGSFAVACAAWNTERQGLS